MPCIRGMGLLRTKDTQRQSIDGPSRRLDLVRCTGGASRRSGWWIPMRWWRTRPRRSCCSRMRTWRIRRFKPDVVITFGGDGGLNNHADHMIASMLTTAAFHWAWQGKRYPDAGNPHKVQRLYYVTSNFAMRDRQPAMMMPWTVRLDI